MSVPFFYIRDFVPGRKELVLEEETSRHIVQVLRMKDGEKLLLTDGLGRLLQTRITAAHKKSCRVEVLAEEQHPAPPGRVSIAISPVKNTSRFEWFLEKVTEIGITEIIPLLCERTEKERFRYDRMLSICISAMLQSQQVWLPRLLEPMPFRDILSPDRKGNRFIAHCLEENRQSLADAVSTDEALILIGPEGDFSPEEIREALQAGFQPVSLGATRLRTETAGVVAAVLLQIK